MNRGDVDSVDIRKVNNGYVVDIGYFSGGGSEDWIPSDKYIFTDKGEAFEFAREKLL